MGKLDGKIALVTGGSDGIGLATAQQFIVEGAEHVFITGRRQQALDEAVRTIAAKNVTAVQGDTSKLADIDRLFEVIKKKTGRLDVLFANAGVADLTPLDSVSEESFDKLFDINVKGVLFTVQKALPIFVDGGSIIINGSAASIKALPNHSVYGATKAAVRSFARGWTVDLKERRIRVNVVSPGPIDTPGMRRWTESKDQRADVAAMVASVPLGRAGTSDEIAKVVVFLASSDSSYITGIELFVDGGSAQI